MAEGPLRQSFTAELDQLRLQVELMGVRVDENLERMRVVLETGDEAVAKPVSKIQPAFADCLPDLLKP